MKINYRMMAPLSGIEFEFKEKTRYPLNDNVHLFINDSSEFPNYNTINTGQFSYQIITGIDSIPFNYYPLLVCYFKDIENIDQHSQNLLSSFIISLSFFKTTNSKIKEGRRIIQTILADGTGGSVAAPGAFDSDMATKYKLSKSELDEFKIFYEKFQNILDSLTDKRMLFAINFYAKASRTGDITEKFIFLSLALEMLFSRENDELSYRFGNRIALLLGSSQKQRECIRTIVKQLYNIRSSLFHGSSFKAPSLNEFLYLNELIRASILQLITLIKLDTSDPILTLDEMILKQDTEEYQKMHKNTMTYFSNIVEFRYKEYEKITEIPI